MQQIDLPEWQTQLFIAQSDSQTLPPVHAFSKSTQNKLAAATQTARQLSILQSRWLLALAISTRDCSDPMHNLNQIVETHTGPALANSPLRVSMSHTRSGELIICAVALSQQRVGLDIEFLHPERRIERIAKRVFPAQECAWLLQNAHASADRFYQLWTLREAAIKAALMQLISDPPVLVVDDKLAPSFQYVSERWHDCRWSLVVNPGLSAPELPAI